MTEPTERIEVKILFFDKTIDNLDSVAIWKDKPEHVKKEHVKKDAAKSIVKLIYQLYPHKEIDKIAVVFIDQILIFEEEITIEV